MPTKTPEQEIAEWVADGDRPAHYLARDRDVLDGAAFVLSATEKVPAIWGQADEVLWASGEPLMICGPQSVGKTTLAQLLTLKRSGVHGGDLLSRPVEVGAGRVLYVAADRPLQAARSINRMIEDADLAPLKMAVSVRKGPLPFDLGQAEPTRLIEWVASIPEVDTLVLDSLKDVAVGLADDAVGARVNQAIQHVIAEGVEVVVLHHQRKAQADNKRPTALDDVYGSTWLTSGVGSVLLVWGQPGDALVELRHLKQPAVEVGPLRLRHDQATGDMAVGHEPEMLELVRECPSGLTVREAASRLCSSGNLENRHIERARRKLERLATDGLLLKAADEASQRVVYRLAERRAA